MMVQQEKDVLTIDQSEIATIQNDGYVAGVDIGGTNLRLALADMGGNIVARWCTSTVGIQDVHKIIGLIGTGLEDLKKQVPTSSSLLRAIAVGVPGITDVDAGIVIATSYLMGWRNVPFRTLLEEAFHVPAVVDNDVNIAAIGESWTGAAAGMRDFVFIAIGTGIGAGLILNGRPFHGMRWNAGEIGYMLVPGVSEEPIERGKPGALEMAIGGEGIKERWKLLWSEQRTSLPKNLTATEIFDHAVTGEPLAQAILDRSARLLAAAIHNISLILNCPLFVLGGSVGIHQSLCDATRNVLVQQNARVLPELKCSTLGTEAQLTGAVRLALDVAQGKPDAVAPNGHPKQRV
jgi:predicted NBD/HSP70 family sugar kinase